MVLKSFFDERYDEKGMKKWLFLVAKVYVMMLEGDDGSWLIVYWGCCGMGHGGAWIVVMVMLGEWRQ